MPDETIVKIVEDKLREGGCKDAVEGVAIVIEVYKQLKEQSTELEDLSDDPNTVTETETLPDTETLENIAKRYLILKEILKQKNLEVVYSKKEDIKKLIINAFGITHPIVVYDALLSQEKERIKINYQSENGDFTYLLNGIKLAKDTEEYEKEQRDQATTVANQDKFKFLANLGLLPHNEILSNKLINLFGKRVFDILHDKARTNDSEEQLSYRKRISRWFNWSSTEISNEKSMDMQINWFMVQMLRALQPADLLLNASISDFNANLASKLEQMKAALTALRKSKGIDGYEQEINERINLEIDAQISKLDKLKKSLDTVKNGKAIKEKDQYYRNEVIQKWQRDAFTSLFHAYRDSESLLGLHSQKVMPLPSENVSNSVVLTNAEYAIQEHTYQEWHQVTEHQLWMTPNECDYIDSRAYCQDGTQRKELLLGACLAESVKDLNKPYDISKETISEVRQTYREKQAEAQAATLNVKQRMPSTSEKIKRKPQQDVTTLKEQSLEWRNFGKPFRKAYFYFKGITLDTALKSLTLTPEEIAQQPADEPAVKEPTLAETISKDIMMQSQIVALTHAPVPDPIRILKSDDALAAVFDFVNQFFLFFDRDVMAKHPYLGLAAFTVPYINIAFPVLAAAMTGNTAALGSAMNIVNNSLLTGEAALAKYTGLNFVLSGFQIHKQVVSVSSLKAAANTLTDGLSWATLAEGSIERALIGCLAAKIMFNTAELLLNNPIFAEHDASLLSEYATDLLPEGMLGSLKSLTGVEKVQATAVAILKCSAQLLIAALGVGAIEHYAPTAISAMFSELATVPWDQVMNPQILNIKVIQTLGVAKAASIILLKMMGIYQNISKGELFDIDGNKLRENSPSFNVLKEFVEVVHDNRKRRALLAKIKQEPEASKYALVRSHFEELLARNPSLYEIYRGADGEFTALNELQVSKLVSKWYTKLPSAIASAIPATVEFFVGLFTFPIMGLVLLGYAIAGSPYPRNPVSNFFLESFDLFMKLPKALWTLTKAVLHTFAKVAVRTPEIIVAIAFSIPLLLIMIPRTFVRVANFIQEKRGKDLAFASDNFFLQAHEKVLQAHATVAHGIRKWFRNPLEDFASWILTKGRNFFLRYHERQLQTFANEEPTSNAATAKAVTAALSEARPAKSENSTSTQQDSKDKNETKPLVEKTFHAYELLRSKAKTHSPVHCEASVSQKTEASDTKSSEHTATFNNQ